MKVVRGGKGREVKKQADARWVSSHTRTWPVRDEFDVEAFPGGEGLPGGGVAAVGAEVGGDAEAVVVVGLAREAAVGVGEVRDARVDGGLGARKRESEKEVGDVGKWTAERQETRGRKRSG